MSNLARTLFAACLLAIASLGPGALPATAADGEPTRTSQQLKRDVLINADMWRSQPTMLAAGLGFTDIIGVPNAGSSDLAEAEAAVRGAGGTWLKDLRCEVTPVASDHTSASTPGGVAYGYGFPVLNNAGLPVEFSWPVLPSTVAPSDFMITLSNGQKVLPNSAAVFPNAEYNERSTVVLFGLFGNRYPSTDSRSVFPVRIEVVADDNPLMLVGKKNGKQDGKVITVSAVGMHSTPTTSPYDNPAASAAERTGPRLVGAKLSRFSRRGEAAPSAFRSQLPNDGRSLYGKRAKFRIRMLTTGGFSPDGVSGIRPNEFSRYFKLIAKTRSGKRVAITRAGRNYRIDGYRLKVIGLADVGRKQGSYDDCYDEDHDNQIDIILNGHKRAMSRIKQLVIPAKNGYGPLYNPGGPGNDPTPGVSYTAGSPTINQKVINALDNPMTVTYRPWGNTRG
ncbi:MAG: phospholipase [Actinomycetota bacterium]|nr:phospholipase [Actinomycetota bacterium]